MARKKKSAPKPSDMATVRLQVMLTAEQHQAFLGAMEDAGLSKASTFARDTLLTAIGRADLIPAIRSVGRPWEKKAESS